MRTEGSGHLKISKDPTGNQTRSLPSCGVLPPPNAVRLEPFHGYYRLDKTFVGLCKVLASKLEAMYTCNTTAFSATLTYSESP